MGVIRNENGNKIWEEIIISIVISGGACKNDIPFHDSD